jgi:hypothetical protein
MKSRNGKITQSVMYYNTCKTFRLNEVLIKDKDTPPLLSKLDQFIPSTKTLYAGNYLLLVYGDNLFGKSSYRLTIAPFSVSSTQVKISKECTKLYNMLI